ncbi:MAG TPA: hypothetical protein VNL18_16590 [Gemmatimonadales bacterium]|nr:hypothetical protein [Gemmatimonadales bacterium]
MNTGFDQLRGVRRIARPVAASLLVTGCFQYVPASYPPPPKPRSEVRLEFASPRDIPMGEFTLNEVTVLEGIVAEATEDTLGLWARWIRSKLGQKYDAQGATFYVPRSDVGRLDSYRFSGKRTFWLTAGLVAATTAAILAVRKTVAGGGGPGTGGDNQSVMAPR